MAAALGGLLAGMLLITSSGAEAAAELTDPDVAAALATSLGDSRTGGVYYDAAGRLVVTVTDQAAASTVEAAGGLAKLVTYSTSYLTSIHTVLNRLPAIPGTSWGIEPATNRVSVEIDSTVSEANEALLKTATAAYGDAVSISRVAGAFKPTFAMVGGMGIKAGVLCSLGFNVQNSAGQKFFVTAGHCVADGGTYWYSTANSYYLGYRYGDYDYGDDGNDYAVIRYGDTEASPYGTVLVNGAQSQITRTIKPTPGMRVARVGAYSADLAGTVTKTNATVVYTDGVKLSGMIQTSLCSEGGDSGGPLFAGDAALGILSGGAGTGTCTTAVSNQLTWFQPLWEVEADFNLHVY
jgi:hypothetical protein